MRAPASRPAPPSPRTVTPGPRPGIEPPAPWIGRPALPAAERIELPGRGTTAVRRLPGPAGAPTVVLLHGWTVTAAVNWHTVFEPLARHVSVVAPDLRGHGDGIRSRRPFRLEDAADDVAALVGTLGLGPVVVAGYSMGGPVAQLVWERHRDLVSGLVLAATFARQTLTRAERVSMRLVGALGRSTRILGRRRQIDLLTHLAERWSTGPERPPWYLAEVRRGSVPMMLEAGGAIARFDSSGWIGGIDVPVGIVLTERDDVVPPDRQHRLAALIPHARLVRLPHGHDCCVTEPDFVPALVEMVRHAAGLGDGAGPDRTGGRR